MFREHNNIVWGGICKCGNECFILQNKFHPWDDVDFKMISKCYKCGAAIEIDKNSAEEYYNNKILSYYNNIEGEVIDLGCGDGFLTKFLVRENKITKIYAIDNDSFCKVDIEKINLNKKIDFINMDITELGKQFKNKEIDYLVNRDVFMFIEDTERYFDDITKIVKKGIKQMGWYLSNSKRMKNRLLPEEIVMQLEKRNWTTKIEYLDWYKSGYFIEAYK